MRWLVLALDKYFDYYLVGEIETITYMEASYRAYLLEAANQLPWLNFDWLTLYVVPDTPQHREMYKKREVKS